ncbi:MAG: hypothetical protein RLY92_741 [Chloroflexota bacterium]
MTSIEKISYSGWPACWRLRNSTVELIATSDVGPRVMRFAFVGGENVLCELPDTLGKTGGTQWRNYGGHRLWHAPESRPRTYHPDNTPVLVQVLDDGIRLTQPAEPTTGIQKELQLTLDPHAAQATLHHRLTNQNLWPVTLAPWAITVMAAGGVAVFPLAPRGSHSTDLLPNSSLSLWSYTDMSDARWTWGRQYVLLRQDPAAQTPQKAGGPVPAGWAAYWRAGQLFIKSFPFRPGAEYPDRGCSFETYTDAQILELESLGPLTTLQPGASVEHVEHWHLVRDVPPVGREADVTAHVLPHLPAPQPV